MQGKEKDLYLGKEGTGRQTFGFLLFLCAALNVLSSFRCRKKRATLYSTLLKALVVFLDFNSLLIYSRHPF